MKIIEASASIEGIADSELTKMKRRLVDSVWNGFEKLSTAGRKTKFG